MFTRVMLIVMFFAGACTPSPIRDSFPSPAPTQAVQEPSEAAVTTSPVADEPLTETAATHPPATSSPIGEDGLQKKLTQVAVNALATQLGVGKEEISVTSSESIVWPDAALGCPMPNQVYERGRVPGFRIRLLVNGQVYDYHTDSTGKVVLCLDPEVKPGEPGLR